MSRCRLNRGIVDWLAFAALNCFSGVAQQPKKLPFVVGISDYFSGKIKPRLCDAEKGDAEMDERNMAKMLESRDYTVTSRLGDSADRSRTIEAQKEFFATTELLRITDVVLVMLSGPSIELPTTIPTPHDPIVEQRPDFCVYEAKPFDESRDIARGKWMIWKIEAPTSLALRRYVSASHCLSATINLWGIGIVRKSKAVLYAVRQNTNPERCCVSYARTEIQSGGVYRTPEQKSKAVLYAALQITNPERCCMPHARTEIQSGAAHRTPNYESRAVRNTACQIGERSPLMRCLA